MKKYCIFSAQYLPHLGGIERYTYYLARELVRRGNDVTVVTMNVERLRLHEESEGIHIYRMPCFNMLNGRYPVSRFLNRNFIRIHRLLVSKHFDFILVNTRFYLHSLYGQRFAKQNHIRCITLDHGTSHLSVNNELLDKLGAVYEHAITSFGRRYCSEYYGVSKACGRWLKHFNIRSAGELYNSIDIEEIEDILKNGQKRFRKEHSIPDSAFVIAFTGRLLPEKGIPQLITAVESLTSQRDDIYLLIAGDGDLSDYINSRSNSHIISTGRLSFHDVIVMLSESDIFCLPSVSEGFSTSLLEAAVCGCYLITTKCGGAGELIADPSMGRILDDNDPVRLEKAILYIADHDEERRKAADKLLTRVRDNFTWNKTADALERIAERNN